ncbi:MAG TPA: hypothetical protein VIF84_11730 [Candidatus Limnocylindrales bacterium]
MREDANGHVQTWTSCADLSNARQITSDPPRNNGWAVWSPDGTHIAFNSDRDDPDLESDPEVWDIYTMRADGTDWTKLTNAVGLLGDPGYSPDGKLIAFDSDEPDKQGIYVLDASDGSNMRLVAALPDDATVDFSPRFSPDGQRLVFSRETGPHSAALYVVNVDGSELTRITDPSVMPGQAAWSPDGTRIAFEADLVAGRGDAWIVGADGSGLRNLTGAPRQAGFWEGFSDPVWSPDGSLIMLIHGKHYDDGRVTGGLATIRPDGTDLRYVTDGLGGEHLPDWNARAC